MTDKTDPGDNDPIEAVLDDPIDAEFREADPKPARSKSGPGWTGSLVIAAIAASIGGFAGYAGSELAPGTLASQSGVIPETDTDRVEDLQEALDQAVGNLDNRLDRLAENDSTLRFTAELNAVRDRLDTLEDVIAPTNPTPGPATPTADDAIEAITGQLDDLSDRLSELEITATTDDPDSAAAEAERAASIQTLRNQVSAVEGRLDQLSENVADLLEQSGSDEAARTSAALALASIDAAARRGDGFAPALSALKRARPDDRRLTPLEAFAVDGAPSLGSLQASFPLSVEMAKAALIPESEAGGAVGWIDRVFGDTMDVRNTSADASYTALEAAAAALQSDDLDLTLRQLETLAPEAKEAMSDWLSRAEARQTLEDTLDMLRLDLMAEDR